LEWGFRRGLTVDNELRRSPRRTARDHEAVPQAALRLIELMVNQAIEDTID
jgi:hypothetical protein